MPNGEFSGQTTECIGKMKKSTLKHCKLSPFLHGTYRPGLMVAQGQWVEAVCDNGYHCKDDNNVRLCQSDGSLSGQEPECVENKECKVPMLSNGYFQLPAFSQIPPGQSLEPICKHGFISQDEILTCLPSGHFDNDKFKSLCKPVALFNSAAGTNFLLYLYFIQLVPLQLLIIK